MEGERDREKLLLKLECIINHVTVHFWFPIELYFGLTFEYG